MSAGLYWAFILGGWDGCGITAERGDGDCFLFVVWERWYDSVMRYKSVVVQGCTRRKQISFIPEEAVRLDHDDLK